VIPKIIWQTHEPEYSDLKDYQLNVISTWKNLNPGWEHRYVSAKERKETVKNFDSFLYECYLESNGVNQSDVWRLIAMYEHGGVYADMDSVCIMPIDDVILKKYSGEEMICTPPGYQTGMWDLCSNNANFAAVKNSTIIKSMLDKIIFKYKQTSCILELNGLELSSLHPGDPCWKIFCDICIKNKDKILFNTDYSDHSGGYKTYFDKKMIVEYNNKKINYLELCKNNNWYIY